MGVNCVAIWYLEAGESVEENGQNSSPHTRRKRPQVSFKEETRKEKPCDKVLSRKRISRENCPENPQGRGVKKRSLLPSQNWFDSPRLRS